MELNNKILQKYKINGIEPQDLALKLFLEIRGFNMPPVSQGYVYVLVDIYNNTESFENISILAYCHWLQDKHEFKTNDPDFSINYEIKNFYHDNQKNIKIISDYFSIVNKVVHTKEKKQKLDIMNACAIELSKVENLIVKNPKKDNNIWIWNILRNLQKINIK